MRYALILLLASGTLSAKDKKPNRDESIREYGCIELRTKVRRDLFRIPQRLEGRASNNCGKTVSVLIRAAFMGKNGTQYDYGEAVNPALVRGASWPFTIEVTDARTREVRIADVSIF